MKRLTAVATSIALLAALPATARADILWDLVHNAGAPDPTTGSYGATTRALTNDPVCGAANNLTCGTITARSNSALFIVGNDYYEIVGGDGTPPDQNNGGAGSLGPYSMGAFSEKGLGLCIAGSSASPNGCLSAAPPFKEIDADAGVNNLFLDLTLVQNSGGLNRLWLTSTQDNEDWIVFGTTAGVIGDGTTGYVEICHGTGNVTAGQGASGFVDIATCGVTDVGYKFLKFSSVGGDGFSGDFSVQALRFSSLSVVPEPGTMGLLATGLVALTGAGFIRRRNKKS
jgi:hypothetical protein